MAVAVALLPLSYGVFGGVVGGVLANAANRLLASAYFESRRQRAPEPPPDEAGSELLAALNARLYRLYKLRDVGVDCGAGAACGALCGVAAALAVPGPAALPAACGGGCAGSCGRGCVPTAADWDGYRAWLQTPSGQAALAGALTELGAHIGPEVALQLIHDELRRRRASQAPPPPACGGPAADH
eukprot:TRINITY_DN67114_c0_g1_i1.p2 TRINITY_DN67114_c0_g1~~TRINITY_DN67114_c0_g1_i1.p2  ORF type:complete len:203 (+),score=55.77 TRINITY_DN67114_c0_g1_i1:57-611(+)